MYVSMHVCMYVYVVGVYLIDMYCVYYIFHMGNGSVVLLTLSCLLACFDCVPEITNLLTAHACV